MKKIDQLYTPDDFKNITKVELFDLWYRQALTEKQIATLFGVTAKDVKDKRKQFNIRWLNSGIASLSGPAEYRNNYHKIVNITPPENWDGKPIKYEKHKSVREKADSDFSELLGEEAEVKKETTKVQEETTESNEELRDAAEVWKEVKEAEQDTKTKTEELMKDVLDEVVNNDETAD